MTRFRQLIADRAGSSAVEFAVSVPVLVMLIWGIAQVGLLYEANAGMQHALGEGARLATIYPTPTDTQIQTKITSAKFGLGNGTWGTPTIVTDNTTKTKTITVTYSQPTDFLFLPGPNVSLSASKVVYLAD
jgi:Flp pilus assembly protein TadG